MANKRETKQERFVRVAEMRTQKILDAFDTLKKCAAPEVYEYTEEQLQQIYGAIEAALQDVKDTFAGLHRFSLADEQAVSIANYEKHLVQGTIRMFLDRGILPEEKEVEYMVSRYTGNMNGDHREELGEFINKEIKRAIAG